MTKKIKISELPDFDPAEHLKDEADIAAYLTVVIEEGDASELARKRPTAPPTPGESAQVFGALRNGNNSSIRL